MKRFVAILLTLFLLCTAFPLQVLATDGVTYRSPIYVDANDVTKGISGFETKTATDATRITDGNVVTLESGWYYVEGEVTILTQIICKGDVHIILKDGATLRIVSQYSSLAGLSVCGVGNDPASEGKPENAVTIYGQSGGTGKLIAYGGGYSAAIGSDYVDDGNVGDPNDLSADKKTFDYHSVPGNNITINGGVIEAYAGNSAAAIGGSALGDAKNITINGGKVFANGAQHGPGIGSGSGSTAVASGITINGGYVEARGGSEASGIGSGYFGKTSGVYINGGVIKAYGDIVDTVYCAPAIGGTKAIGSLSMPDSLSEDIYVSSNMVINAGASANDVCEIAPAHTAATDIADDFIGQLYAVLVPVENSYNAPIYNTDGDMTSGVKRWERIAYTTHYNLQIDEITKAKRPTSIGAAGETTWYFVRGGTAASPISISGITVYGNVNLVLTEGCYLKTDGGASSIYYAGITVSGGGSLNIYGQGDGSGTLVAVGGKCAGGICGSNITVYGGNVTATAGGSAAGIGGGNGKRSQPAGTVGNLNFVGGNVTAVGGTYAAAIGGGGYASASGICIVGGTINTQKGIGGSDIGAGKDATATNVKVYGGSFSNNLPEGYLADGCAVKSVDSRYVIVPGYSVKIPATEGGTVTSDKRVFAVEGFTSQTVTLTVSATQNYYLDSLTVTAGGEEITCTQNGNQFTFTMPAQTVTVTAVFAKNLAAAQHVPAKEADCTDGNVEYWTFNGAYYLDENLTQKTTKAAVIIPALGHTETFVRWDVRFEGGDVKFVFVTHCSRCEEDVEHVVAYQRTVSGDTVTHKASYTFGGQTYNKEISQKTVYVASYGDDANDGSMASPVKTLAKALSLAVYGDTVKLLTDVTASVTVKSTAMLTLDLNGHVLKGAGGSVITNEGKLTVISSDKTTDHYFTAGTNAWSWSSDVAVTENTVTGGVITGGNTAGNVCGGAINNKGTLKVCYVNFVGNAANAQGGAVYNTGKAVFENCKFVGNYAKAEGGAISTAGTADTSLLDVTVTGNKGMLGGGIFVSDSGNFTVGGEIKVTDNTATGYGENLFVSGETKVLKINELNPLSAGSSIGIRRMSGEGAVAILSETEASYFFSDDETMGMEYALGVLYVKPTNPEYVAVVVANGAADSTGFYCRTISDAVYSCFVSHNDESDTYRVKLLYNVTENVELYNGQKITIDLNGYVWSGTGEGSVIKVEQAAELNIVDSRPTLKHRYDTSEDVWVWDDVAGTETVLGGAIVGGCNTTPGFGGGAINNASGKPLRLTGINLIGNVGYYGGAIYNSGSNVTITGCTFAGNYAIAAGGALLLSPSSPSDPAVCIKDTVFTYNKTATGGAISTGLSLRLENVTLTYNRTTGDYSGGVIANDRDGLLFTLIDCTVQYNKSKMYGGAFLVQGYTLIVGGKTVISDNKSDYEYAGNKFGDNNVFLFITGSMAAATGEDALSAGACIYACNLVGGTDCCSSVTESDLEYFASDYPDAFALAYANNKISFTPRTVTATLTQGAHGTATLSQNGGTVTVNVTPDEGYKFSTLILRQGANVSVTSKNSFTIMFSNVTVTPVFVSTDVVHVEKKAASCFTEGNYEYWVYNDIYYLSDSLEEPVDAEDIVIPAIGHHEHRNVQWACTFVNGVPKFYVYADCTLCGEKKVCYEATVTTSEHAGYRFYDAEITINGQPYTNSKTISIEDYTVTLNGAPVEGTYRFGDVVTLTVAGGAKCDWYYGDVADGILVCRGSNTYSCVVNGNLAFNTVATEEEATPTVAIIASERVSVYPTETDPTKVEYLVKWDVPEQYTFLEAGIVRGVVTDDTATAADLTKTNVSALKTRNGTFKLTLQIFELKNISLGAMGYVKYLDKLGEEQIIYSNLAYTGPMDS